MPWTDRHGDRLGHSMTGAPRRVQVPASETNSMAGSLKRIRAPVAGVEFPCSTLRMEVVSQQELVARLSDSQAGDREVGSQCKPADSARITNTPFAVNSAPI